MEAGIDSPKIILFNLNGGTGQFLPPTKDGWVSLAELYERKGATTKVAP